MLLAKKIVLYKRQADREFLMKIVQLALPVAFQSLLFASANFIDLSMLGQVGQTEVASIGICGRIFSISRMILFALSGTATIYTSQYWGKHNTKGIRESIAINMTTAFFVCVPFFAVFLLRPSLFFEFNIEDAVLIKKSSQYLQIIGFSVFTTAIFTSLSNSWLCIGKARIVTLFNIIGIISNIIVSYILIFGKLGAPRLGIIGAAYGTLFSRIFETILLIIYTYHNNKELAPVFEDYKNILNWKKIQKFLKIAGPLISNAIVWSGGLYILDLIYAMTAMQNLASISILSPIERITASFFYGLATATNVILGHLLGAKKFAKAWMKAHLLLLLSFVLAIILVIFLLFSIDFILSIFSSVEEATLENSKKIFFFLLLLIMLKSINVVTIVGILRSGGDTKFCFFLDLFCQWGIGIPFTFLAAIFFQLPVHVIFLVSISEEFVKMFLCFFRMRTKRWVKNLV